METFNALISSLLHFQCLTAADTDQKRVISAQVCSRKNASLLVFTVLALSGVESWLIVAPREVASLAESGVSNATKPNLLAKNAFALDASVPAMGGKPSE